MCQMENRGATETTVPEMRNSARNRPGARAELWAGRQGAREQGSGNRLTRTHSGKNQKNERAPRAVNNIKGAKSSSPRTRGGGKRHLKRQREEFSKTDKRHGTRFSGSSERAKPGEQDAPSEPRGLGVPASASAARSRGRSTGGEASGRAGRTPHVLGVTEGTASASAGSVTPESAVTGQRTGDSQRVLPKLSRHGLPTGPPTGRRPDPSAETDTCFGDTFSTSACETQRTDTDAEDAVHRDSPASGQQTR